MAALITKGSQNLTAAMGFGSQRLVHSRAVGFCNGEMYLEEEFCRVVENLECVPGR